MKHVIVGGVAGGATAAARIRRNDENAEIIILEKGSYISYANCGLPYYIGGVINERSRLLLQTPTTFGTRFNVDVRIENEVIRIDPEKKIVHVKNENGAIYQESYDKLLLSPGAAPIRPNIEGIDLDGVFSLRNIPDTDKIKKYVSEKVISRALIVGAGFIGLEMAENLHHLGAQVHIAEKLDQVMAPIDFSMAQLVHRHLTEKGVQLHLGESVTKFQKNEDSILVYLESGKMIETDVVILSIGFRPEIGFVQDSGIKIGEARGIWVNEYLETSVKDIYAVGDAIEFPHPITGKPWMNYLANPANRQGRLVADNMVFGNKEPYEGAIGTSIAKIFDITVASTGLAAKKLKSLDIPYISSWTHSGSHAGYYPGSTRISLKITFEPETGRILGAQGVGYDGVDKRIDQISLLIKMGKTIYDLMAVEHCYAPPFSSAKDPIAMAGYVANNILSKKMDIVSWREVKELDLEKVTLIDVRTVDEVAMGTIPGSINIPVDELRSRMIEIPKDKPIVIFCAIGLRSYLASNILKANHFNDVKYLSGGYTTYSAAVAPIVNQELPLFKGPKLADDAQVSFMREVKNMITIDATGLQCPGPILKLRKAVDDANSGDQITVTSTDPGFIRDVEAWCNSTQNLLISTSSDKGIYEAIVEKGIKRATQGATLSTGEKNRTFIMFSDDLDKALATMVLANGAAASGDKVTIFFTFWGLNVIKKVNKPKLKKGFFDKMFSFMLPSHSLKLKLSKLSMWGLGDRLMRHLMKEKGIDSLESLREQALQNGVEFIACQMSMDMMGIRKEELLDVVTVGGVATYMERADDARINLFI